jgi:DNA polymerase-1
MTVLLFDGYNVLFRSFTSLPQAIVGEDGKPINAVYGALNFLLRLMRELETSRMVWAMDTPSAPTFRHELYPPYQGQRGPMGGDDAPEFARQAAIATRVFPRLGVPVFSLARFEADDVMGSLAVGLADAGERAIIVSTDRDLLQLVRDGVEALAPGNPPIRARTAEDVRDRMGVGPQGITTFKALAGDASDNIPGVRGIGTKTAATLVNEYGSLESIYDNLAALPRGTAAKLEAGRKDAFLFRTIVTVVTDLELPLDEVRCAEADFGLDDRARTLLERATHDLV